MFGNSLLTYSSFSRYWFHSKFICTWCYFQPFNSSFYILHLTATTAHNICLLFSAIQKYRVYTALNSHYCNYICMLFSAIQQFPLYTALNSHYCNYICMLFSAIQQFPLYTLLNSHYCTPHLYVIFSHSTVPCIYCT